ncbi:MAG: tRNA adenosine(34) deaminase TadA [Firmicutes bacterium]|nr:tRNA adenosine(34) deaminase TadA [Bacillota bacterium]
MKQALAQARQALQRGEVPIGAVVVCEGRVVGAGYNQRIQESDATAHAEVVALRQAGRALGRWNLSGCQLYVTLEPCVMCAGAIVNARIDTVYYGAKDDKWGAMGSRYQIGSEDKCNHRCQVESGILQEECGALLRDFFSALRHQKKELGESK